MPDAMVQHSTVESWKTHFPKDPRSMSEERRTQATLEDKHGCKEMCQLMDDTIKAVRGVNAAQAGLSNEMCSFLKKTSLFGFMKDN